MCADGTTSYPRCDLVEWLEWQTLFSKGSSGNMYIDLPCQGFDRASYASALDSRGAENCGLFSNPIIRGSEPLAWDGDSVLIG